MYEFDDSNGDLIGNLDKAHALKPQCLFMSVTLCVAMICDWTCAVREVFINATGEASLYVCMYVCLKHPNMHVCLKSLSVHVCLTLVSMHACLSV